MQLNGKQLAIPQYININAFYINKDAMKEWGQRCPQRLRLRADARVHPEDAQETGDKGRRFGFTTGGPKTASSD